MVFRQNGKLQRVCSICEKNIDDGDWLMVLFSQDALEKKHKLEHAHVSCAGKAVETWLKKKRQAK